MKSEFLRIQEIKKHFDWPVDRLRYGLPGANRYLLESGSAAQLSLELQERVRFSLAKAKIAQQLLRYLAHLPWVKMIFLTGSVASLNALPDDDIDVWIIVEPRRIWLTRAIDFLLYTLLGRRRLAIDGVSGTRVSNKLCFNFYSTTDAYTLGTKSISFAMQFVDSIPVFIRRVEDFRELVTANEWVQQYFPSWYYRTCAEIAEVPAVPRQRSGLKLVLPILTCIDYLAGVSMILKAEHRLILSPTRVFRAVFTTWGTPRILSVHDNETIPESSEEGK